MLFFYVLKQSCLKMSEIEIEKVSTDEDELSEELKRSIVNLSNEILKNKKEQERVRHKNIMPADGYEFNLSFPIKKMDKIHVNVVIKLRETTESKTILFSIYSSTIYLAGEDEELDEDGPEDVERVLYNHEEILIDDDPKYTVEFIQEALSIVYKKIKNSKFDKYTGKFIYKCDQDISFDDWNTYLSNIQNIELNFQDCCVCLDKTSTKTSCHHSLCYSCWTNLKYTVSDKFNEDTFKCPYCREDISF